LEITIGMFGFGKTGAIVAKEVLKDEQCVLKWIIRKTDTKEGEYASHLFGFEHDEGRIYSSDKIDHKTFYKENPVDVIIDFSSVNALQNHKYLAEEGIKIVSAISKYEPEHLEKLKKLGEKTAVLYSPNITLGINFLIEASKVLKKIIPNADIEIVEEHFRGKKETSGTAIRIAEYLELDKEKQVNSIRVGGIVGKHEVIFGLPNQTIRIVHESISRDAFGQGAIYAAKWIIDKNRGIFSMEEALALNFAKKPEKSLK